MRTRPERVANAIKKEVSQILQEELKDPRIGFATITAVRVTKDLKDARVFFSVLGDAKAKKNSIHGLNSAAGYIRGLIGDRLGLRYTPTITFELDESVEFLQRMEDILGGDK